MRVAIEWQRFVRQQEWQRLTRQQRIDRWIERVLELSQQYWKRRWEEQKAGARGRSIPFRLTFKQWLAIWRRSGHMHERGRGRGQYVMARHRDKGGYEVGNVAIVTVKQNNDTKWEEKFGPQRAYWAPVSMRFPEELFARVDAWRRVQPELLTRTEAVRRLVLQGIEVSSKRRKTGEPIKPTIEH